MSDILLEFEKYISNNKEVIGVLPINTKKNKSIYLEKVDELYEKALKVKEIVWNEIEKRYNRITSVEESPQISEFEYSIANYPDIELFNELNTAFEKLGLDRIAHGLSQFFEGDLGLVNENIKKYIDKYKEYGIELTEDDFSYSPYVSDYMKVFFEEYKADNIDSDKLKKHFETLYWKCPDLITHIELNMRYLYFINSKKLEKELKEKTDRILDKAENDKNGLVREFFELNKALIKLKRTDPKYITGKFMSDEWRVNDFNDKEMSVLYDRLYSKDYYSLDKDKQDEVDNNFGKLLNTLEEYHIYKRFKYIIDDIKEKYQNKDSFKDSYENKNKELRKKEQALIKENEKNKKLILRSKNPFFRLFRKKMEKKIYEFPIFSNTQIKELKTLYTELDEEKVNQKVVEYVDENCSIKYMLKIAISHYPYAFNLVRKNHMDDGVDATTELNVLLDFINNPYKVMLNNIKLGEEPEVASIISNRYKILNIKLEKENLIENFDSIVQDTEKIVNFSNIRKSHIDLDDMTFLEKVKPMMTK